jgi:hypothetical protein
MQNRMPRDKPRFNQGDRAYRRSLVGRRLIAAELLRVVWRYLSGGIEGTGRSVASASLSPDTNWPKLRL